MYVLKKAEGEKGIADIQALEEITGTTKSADTTTGISNRYAAKKLTEEHRVLAQQKAEKRAIAEKKADEKQKAEEADAITGFCSEGCSG